MTSLAGEVAREVFGSREVPGRGVGPALLERRQRSAQLLARLLAAAAFGSADRAMSMVGRMELAFVGTGTACRKTRFEDVELRWRMGVRLPTKHADCGGACVRAVEA